MSSYLEALGTLQTVAGSGDVTFDIDPDEIDIAGNDIRPNADGKSFTIYRAGLYLVEWSLDITSSDPPVIVGLLENGLPASGISNAVSSGNLSSGTLINVEAGDLPYTISLHNFGREINIGSAGVIGNTAASIRILRFADGPST